MKKYISKHKEIIIFAVIAIVANIAIFSSYHTARARKISCASFKTHAEAQKAFDSDPIKYKALDADKDGKACEALK